MATKRQAFSMDHPIIITFLIFAVIAFMSLASEVLKPLALAILLSFALAPLSRFFEKRGLPRPASVILTVVLALGLLSGIGYKVTQELSLLSKNLSEYEKKILAKAEKFRPTHDSALEKLSKVGTDVANTLEKPQTRKDVINVSVVSQPTFTQRLQTAVGPYLENLGVGAFVLILVLFILMNREDLSDRIIRLVGQQRVSLTTKTMEEVGRRISRYLMMFAMVNSTFGLVVGLGLWVIGVPYAVLWGVLAALLRFIPYVGPATAFALPLVFSIASSPADSWRQPMMVLGLFGILEVAANTFLEPVIYGKTTGVSALGLLVAAMFWTWLWGSLGLLLSTPMTVCLAVLGKYVPNLRVFATLLGEEAVLKPDVRFYQRLLAIDQDGATEFVDAALKQQPRAEVFDQILIPTLIRAQRDHEKGDIDDRTQAYIWRVVGDILEEVEETPEYNLKTLSAASPNGAPPAIDGAATLPATSARLVGVPVSDHADLLALRMLSILLVPANLTLEIVENKGTPLKLAEHLAELDPALLVLSHLPPIGFTTARYLVRRLRARLGNLPVLVGRWGEIGNLEKVTEQLTLVGATNVVDSVADAREAILKRFAPDPALAAEQLRSEPSEANAATARN